MPVPHFSDNHRPLLSFLMFRQGSGICQKTWAGYCFKLPGTIEPQPGSALTCPGKDIDSCPRVPLRVTDIQPVVNW